QFHPPRAGQAALRSMNLTCVTALCHNQHCPNGLRAIALLNSSTLKDASRSQNIPSMVIPFRVIDSGAGSAGGEPNVMIRISRSPDDAVIRTPGLLLPDRSVTIEERTETDQGAADSQNPQLRRVWSLFSEACHSLASIYSSITHELTAFKANGTVLWRYNN